MKKIMYNDRYGLTDAVLEGRKTVTRRIAKRKDLYENDARILVEPQYKVGEIVAIAQSMRNVCSGSDLDIRYLENLYGAAWNNKMFVKSELMPHQIEILDVRVERLQDITDEDCIKEGVKKFTKDGTVYKYGFDGLPWQNMLGSPREAFASLIDKVAKKGTWKSNPYVFRYEFKLK